VLVEAARARAGDESKAGSGAESGESRGIGANLSTS
jgi:hypothetical protein